MKPGNRRETRRGAKSRGAFSRRKMRRMVMNAVSSSSPYFFIYEGVF